MPRILHFGLGNFARAHLADYTQDAGGWDIVGVSLRAGTVRDGLAAQGFAYDLDVQGQGIKRIDVLKDILVAPENPDAVLGQITAPRVQVISATVTEKGYHLDGNGVLDLQETVIRDELAKKAPRSLIGYLAHGLAMRTTPVTVLSCDNMPGNGDRLGAAVQRFGRCAGLSINFGHITFPNAMVDRITPASAQPDVVHTEAFREWVIEDRFAAPRPHWPDVQFVQDVAPHELRKLRMLNGAHSYLAYAGCLAGYVHVHEAINDAQLRKSARDVMDQAALTLPQAVQGQAEGYADALIARFENPQLAHRLRQIAMDGTQKLPYRLVAPLRARGTSGAAGLGIAAWMQFCHAQNGAVDDPQHAQITTALRAADPRKALLALIGAADLDTIIPE